jgi:hypothetical protein
MPAGILNGTMKKGNIQIAGKEVTVAWCYATEIAFMKYTGNDINNFDATNPEHIVYMILAALMAYYQSKNEEPPVKDENLMYEAKPQEIVDALKVIFDLRNQWYEVSDNDVAPTSDKSKN